MPELKRLSVIIPVYNEEKTVADIIAKVKAASVPGLSVGIVAVDDGSADRSLEILTSIAGIRVVSHPKNRGKGAAIKSGLQAADGDVFIIQDADLEYDPADYAAVLAPILEGRAELVLGSRFLREKPAFFFGPRRSPFFSHYAGNKAIIALTNLLYGRAVTDYEGGYKAFTRGAVASLDIREDGFAFDNELVCKLFRKGCRFAEVPIRYSPRTYGEGKKIRWTDGLAVFWTIVKWRVLPAPE